MKTRGFLIGATVLWLAVSYSTTGFADGKKITLKLDGVSARQAAEAVFVEAGLNYAITVSGDGKTYGISLKDVPALDAIKAVMRQCGLTYAVSDGIYIVSRETTAPIRLGTLAPALPKKPDTLAAVAETDAAAQCPTPSEPILPEGMLVAMPEAVAPDLFTPQQPNSEQYLGRQAGQPLVWPVDRPLSYDFARADSIGPRWRSNPPAQMVNVRFISGAARWQYRPMFLPMMPYDY